MDSKDLQEQLLRRTTETLARLDEARRHDAKRRGRSPCPGDLYIFAATADHEVQWAVLKPPTEAGGFFLVIPADVNPMVGSADVAVPAAASSGALTLRCGFEVWLPETAFDTNLCTGSLPLQVLEEAQTKWARLHQGPQTHQGTALERETDNEPEYRHWVLEILSQAQIALSEIGKAALENRQAQEN